MLKKVLKCPIIYKKGYNMAQASNGATVKVHYTGKLADGTIFDSSRDRDPLEFKLGEKQLIQGFEDAILGMNVGDSKTVVIPAEKGYGQYHEEMKAEIEKSQFPDNIALEIGQRIQLKQEEGQIVAVTITDVTDTMVTLDANHPLAGKELTFEMELIEIM